MPNNLSLCVAEIGADIIHLLYLEFQNKRNYFNNFFSFYSFFESGANEDLAKRDPSTFTEAKRM